MLWCPHPSPPTTIHTTVYPMAHTLREKKKEEKKKHMKTCLFPTAASPVTVHKSALSIIPSHFFPFLPVFKVFFVQLLVTGVFYVYYSWHHDKLSSLDTLFVVTVFRYCGNSLHASLYELLRIAHKHFINRRGEKKSWYQT